MADNNNYEIAGKGSFGIVLKPALPNINNNGNKLKFPSNVSKIYINHGSYRNALNTTRRIKNKIPSLNIDTHNYKRRYTIKNLPNSIKQRVKNYLNEKHSNINNDVNLPLLRMSDLGYAASDINNNGEYYRVLRQIPFRQICSEMYKCMNVVKAIHEAGYIHGDIRESNLLFNLNNAVMTIIDFDWLKPFNEIYNTYPEFFYSWPSECLFVFGRKTKKGQKIDASSLLRQDMTFRSNETIMEFYNKAVNKFDYYIPYDATKGMRHFLNDISPFNSNARNQNEWYEDVENYYNKIRLELFNITKDYIDMYGLGISFYKLLKRAWAVNINIHGIEETKNGDILLLKDVSNDIKDGKYTMGGVDNTNDKEIRKFSDIRKFIFDELLPGMVHSNYTKRWTIDEAIEKFREKISEIDADIVKNEEKIVSNELKRLELLALVRNNKYNGVNINHNGINNKSNGGKSGSDKRKTRKNKSN
jgi:serine/threonine protein kinase